MATVDERVSRRMKPFSKATAPRNVPSTNQVKSVRARAAALAFRCQPALAALVCAVHLTAFAAPVPVHHPEGTLHGFLSLATEQGKVLADGDLIEIVHGDRVTAHLVFHFKDGSLDDETTVFTQHSFFRLISDHHIQRGPYFPHPLDMSIDVQKGIVVTRSPGKEGKDEFATSKIKMPPDLYNGLVIPVIKNISRDAGETKVSMIVAAPKPRVVTLDMMPQAPDTFYLAGIPRKATVYEIKIELGGVAGIVAPVIGKQPPNIMIEIFGGELPAFLRETGPVFEGGERLIISQIGPTWTAESHDQQGR